MASGGHPALPSPPPTPDRRARFEEPAEGDVFPARQFLEDEPLLAMLSTREETGIVFNVTSEALYQAFCTINPGSGREDAVISRLEKREKVIFYGMLSKVLVAKLLALASNSTKSVKLGPKCFPVDRLNKRKETFIGALSGTIESAVLRGIRELEVDVMDARLPEFNTLFDSLVVVKHGWPVQRLVLHCRCTQEVDVLCDSEDDIKEFLDKNGEARVYVWNVSPVIPRLLQAGGFGHSDVRELVRRPQSTTYAYFLRYSKPQKDASGKFQDKKKRKFFVYVCVET